MKQQRPVSLARRVWPALAVAGASAAFVSALDKPTQFVTDKVSLTGAEDPAGSATVLSVPPVEPIATVAGSVRPQGVATTIPPAPQQAQPHPQPQPQPQPVAPAAAACGPAINGPVVDTRWGPVQVQAHLTADHKVCNVIAVQTPSAHSRSIQINDYARPILHKRAIAAGSAQFNGVSGATITSRGYAASLQYILDHN